MQRTIPVFLVLSLCVAAAHSEEPSQLNKADKSPLLEKGNFDDVHKQLEQIFSFTYDGARLKIDRASWGTPPKKEEEAPIGFRMPPGPPIETIFNAIQAAAGGGGRSMGMNGNNRTSTFTSPKMSGSLRTRDAAVRMSLEETEAPHRVLEFQTDTPAGFRILLTHPDGDMIVLSQGDNGRCSALAVVSGRTFAAQGDSFADLFKKHRTSIQADVLPGLEALGIQLVPAPSSPKVGKMVVALLGRTPETEEEGKKLLADLDAEQFATRQKAAQLLADRFVLYQDLIHARLKAKPSLESQTRLEKIVSENADVGRLSRALAALDLLRDTPYLISLLEHLAPAEAASVMGHLEKATGQKFDSVAGWKEWLKK